MANKDVENHHRFTLTLKAEWAQVAEEEIHECPRWTSSSWPGEARADQAQFLHLPRTEGGTTPTPRAGCRSPFSPSSHHNPPTYPPLPSKSSHISCQERDLLQPVWWRPQLQTGWYFHLAPASCLLAGGFYLLVFHFVISDTDAAPLLHQNRTKITVSSKGRLPATSHLPWGPSLYPLLLLHHHL